MDVVAGLVAKGSAVALVLGDYGHARESSSDSAAVPVAAGTVEVWSESFAGSAAEHLEIGVSEADEAAGIGVGLATGRLPVRGFA